MFIEVVFIELLSRSRNGTICGVIRYISIYSSSMNSCDITSTLREDSITFLDFTYQSISHFKRDEYCFYLYISILDGNALSK